MNLTSTTTPAQAERFQRLTRRAVIHGSDETFGKGSPGGWLTLGLGLWGGIIAVLTIVFGVR